MLLQSLFFNRKQAYQLNKISFQGTCITTAKPIAARRLAMVSGTVPIFNSVTACLYHQVQ